MGKHFASIFNSKFSVCVCVCRLNLYLGQQKINQPYLALFYHRNWNLTEISGNLNL